MNMDDIFSQFGDIFGDDVFGSFFGGGQARTGKRRQGIKGSNLRIKLKLNYEELAKGVTKSVKVKKYVPCNTCHGSGAKDKNSVQTCGSCGGSGQVRKVTNTFLGQMQTVTTCPTCNGEGSIITAKCGNCKGEGRVYGEETLKQVAENTNGIYVRLQGTNDAVNTLMKQLSQIEGKAFGDVSLMNYKTWYLWFAGAMLLLLLAEIFIPARKKQVA